MKKTRRLTILIIAASIVSASIFFWKNQHHLIKKSALERKVEDKPSNSQYPTTLLVDTSDWKVYRNEKYGFEFKYPPFEDGWTLLEYHDRYPLGKVATGVRVYYDYGRTENSQKRGEMFDVSFVEGPFGDLYLRNPNNPNLFFFDLHGKRAATYEHDKDLMYDFLNHGKCEDLIVFGLLDLSSIWALGGQVSIECDATYTPEQHIHVLKAILDSVRFF